MVPVISDFSLVSLVAKERARRSKQILSSKLRRRAHTSVCQPSKALRECGSMSEPADGICGCRGTTPTKFPCLRDRECTLVKFTLNLVESHSEKFRSSMQEVEGSCPHHPLTQHLSYHFPRVAENSTVHTLRQEFQVDRGLVSTTPSWINQPALQHHYVHLYLCQIA